jgi:hypothetical protein
MNVTGSIISASQSSIAAVIAKSIRRASRRPICPSTGYALRPRRWLLAGMRVGFDHRFIVAGEPSGVNRLCPHGKRGMLDMAIRGRLTRHSPA